MKNISSSNISEKIPSSIDFSQTIFSLSNLLIFSTVVIVITAFFYILGKNSKPTKINLPIYKMTQYENITTKSERLDNSKVLAVICGLTIILAFFYRGALGLPRR